MTLDGSVESKQEENCAQIQQPNQQPQEVKGGGLGRHSRCSKGTELYDRVVNWRTIFSKSRIDPHLQTETVVHYPRLFAFLALFMIPFAISVATVMHRDVFRSDASNRVEYDGAALQFSFGFFTFAYSIADVGSDSVAVLSTYPTDWVVVPYSSLCSSNNVSPVTRWNARPLVDPSVFCSNLWRTVQAVEIIALISGGIALLLIADNVLVWSNASFWFRPARHPNSHVRIVRKVFKVGINHSVLGHMSLQIIASIIVISLKDSIRWPDKTRFDFGMWLAVISWGADLLFVLLFFCFDQFTFFHTSIALDEDNDNRIESV